MTTKVKTFDDAQRVLETIRSRLGRARGLRGIGVVRDGVGAHVRVNVDGSLSDEIRAQIPVEFEGVQIELRTVGNLKSFA